MWYTITRTKQTDSSLGDEAVHDILYTVTIRDGIDIVIIIESFDTIKDVFGFLAIISSLTKDSNNPVTFTKLTLKLRSSTTYIVVQVVTVLSINLIDW